VDRHECDFRLDVVLDLIKTEREQIKTREIAKDLGVSCRTIASDVKFLRKTYPQIKAKMGRYGGGLYWDE
jgi:predicted DNA-binding transcriptional regulator YafY